MPRLFPTPVLFKPSLVAAILAVSFSVQLMACSVPHIPTGTAVVLLEQQARNLDPLFAADAVSHKIGNLVQAGLLRFTPEMRIEGELAASWTVRGYHDFRFKLRPGLRFHDGSPLKAQDVVRSFEAFKKNSPHGVALAHVKRLWSEGDLIVRLETDRPQPFFLHDLPLLKIFKRTDGRVIGAGRYKTVSESPTDILAVAADTYFEPLAAGAFDRIIFKYVSDDTTRYQYLIRGDGNVLINALSLTKAEYLRQHLPAGMRIIDAVGINYSYICINFKEPHLANLKVRQAIAHAIDTETILKYRIGRTGYRATGILAPAHGHYYEPNVVVPGFNRAKAERLLDEAGYPRKLPGGWRFSLSFKTTPEKFGNEMARVLSNELRQVGIDVRLEIVEQGTFFADVNAGNFQLFHSRWIGVNNPSIYFRAFHSSQRNRGMNRGAYVSAEMDQLLEKGMAEVSDRKRREYFSKAQKLAASELPYVNLWHWNNTFIGTEAMGNIVMYPNGDYRTLAEVRTGKAK